MTTKTRSPIRTILFSLALALLRGCGGSYTAYAQVQVTPVVVPHVTFVNGVGLPCAGCHLYTYTAGTTTPLATYTDAGGTSQNTNPIVLDPAGGANIWVGTSSYKFILKDILGNTIWSVDQVNAGSLTVCATPSAVQIANSAATGLTCDSSITINTTNHTLNVGTLPANYVTIGALGTPTSWTFDTTTPATALASLGGGTTGSGTANQIAYYATNGPVVQGTSAIPAGIIAITQSPGDNSANPATTAYVALPGAINPTSIQIASGTALTGDQGNGALLQHSTGTATPGDCAQYDANGNTTDAGAKCATVTTTRACNANGCYRVEGDGTITAWGIVAGCVDTGSSFCNTPINFPTTFTTTTNLAVEVTCGGNFHNCVPGYSGVSTSGFSANLGSGTLVGGSGTRLNGTETVSWTAVGN